MSLNMNGTVTCDMVKTCNAPITHLDEKGFVYCRPHGIERKDSHRCRQLKPAELRQVLRGEPLATY